MHVNICTHSELTHKFLLDQVKSLSLDLLCVWLCAAVEVID